MHGSLYCLLQSCILVTLNFKKSRRTIEIVTHFSVPIASVMSTSDFITLTKNSNVLNSASDGTQTSHIGIQVLSCRIYGS